MKYTYIIIDDNKQNALYTQAIFDSFENYNFVGSALNHKDALFMVAQHKPDIIVLEIDPTNKKSGLSLGIIHEIHRYSKANPQVIVLTKDTQLAFEALKSNVLDYIKKPLDTFELQKSILRFEEVVRDRNTVICVKSYGDYRFVEADEVVYLKADSNSTDMYTNSGNVVIAFKSMKHFESILPSQFVRIHKSYIVNMKYIARIYMSNNACYLKNSKTHLPFSQTYRRNVISILNYFARKEDRYG